METGFEDKKTENLIKIVENIRAGLDRLCEVPFEDLFKGDVKNKQSARIASAHFMAVMLPIIEMELWKRGIDTKAIPGHDWTSLFVEMERDKE